jgi:hypothetical protein
VDSSHPTFSNADIRKAALRTISDKMDGTLKHLSGVVFPFSYHGRQEADACWWELYRPAQCEISFLFSLKRIGLVKFNDSSTFEIIQLRRQRVRSAL